MKTGQLRKVDIFINFCTNSQTNWSTELRLEKKVIKVLHNQLAATKGNETNVTIVNKGEDQVMGMDWLEELNNLNQDI